MKEKGRYKTDDTFSDFLGKRDKDFLTNTLVNVGNLEEFCLFG